MRPHGLAVLAGLAMASPVAAGADFQPPETGTETVTRLEEVEVFGRRIQERAEQFVSEAVTPPQGRRLARWTRPLCVGVVNMKARHAQFMIDRIAQVALDAGLDVDEPGCRPDIMIVATADGSAMARELVADDRQSFRPSRQATDRGAAALEQFQAGEAPVRWWHVSLPVTVDTGDIAIKLDGDVFVGVTPLYVPVRDASRLRANTREDLMRATIILDVSKIGAIPFGALSDYVAMIALAQIEPEADLRGHDTILNLFVEDAPPSSMSDWDRDFLRALYAAPNDRARATQQSLHIVQDMTRTRTLAQESVDP